MGFRIEYSPEFVDHLAEITASDRRRIMDTADRPLESQPTVQTRNRKPMRPNQLATWELRIADFRVYHDLDVDAKAVFVRALGVKVRDRVIVGGREVDLS